MKNKSLVSKVIPVLVVLFIIRSIVGFKTIYDDRQLFKIGKEAITAFNNKEITKANSLIKQGDEIHASSKLLRTLTVDFNDSYNYINSSNTIKGRIALKDGKLELAKEYLLASASISSTPTLNNFGPNMSLAQDLLQIGETKIVDEYLDKCKLFWEDDRGQVSKWKKQIQVGEMPAFGANLWY